MYCRARDTSSRNRNAEEVEIKPVLTETSKLVFVVISLSAGTIVIVLLALCNVFQRYHGCRVVGSAESSICVVCDI